MRLARARTFLQASPGPGECHGPFLPPATVSEARIVNRTSRNFPELLSSTRRFTMSTRGRLERALVNALQGHRHGSAIPLQQAVVDATNELRTEGLNDGAVLSVLGLLVEDAGRACGADRPSLMSGEPRWLPVRTRVLALAGT